MNEQGADVPGELPGDAARGGPLWLLGLCVGGGAAFGALYGLTISIVPVMYLGLFVEVVCSCAVGCCVVWGAKLAGVTRASARGWWGLIGGLCGLYVSWVVWVWAYGQYRAWLWEPAELLAAMGAIAQERTWVIGGSASPAGDMTGIWIIEAVVFVVVAAFTSRMGWSFGRMFSALGAFLEAVTGSGSRRR